MSTIVLRPAALTGTGFVALVLVGNSLTESVAVRGSTPGEEALATFEAQAASSVFHVGLAAELLAFVCLAGFAVHLVVRLRERGALGAAGMLAAFAALWTVAVKTGSGAAYLAGTGHHADLSPDVALGLVASNGAAFVLTGLSYGVFVAASAQALRTAELVGRPGWLSGLAIGVAGVVLAVVGAPDPVSAVPLAFLAGLLWLGVVGVRLALARTPRSADPVTARATADVA